MGDVLEVIAVMMLVCGVAAFVLTPLRRSGASATEAERRRDGERAVLEATKEAKYREIRETELDYRMGKLTEEQWRGQDRVLRGEAIDVLDALDALGVADEETGSPTAAAAE